MFNTHMRELVPWRGGYAEDDQKGTALSPWAPDEGARAVAQILLPGYAWFYEDNQQEALLYAQGWLIAREQKLPQQAALYQTHITQLAWRDCADRAQALIVQALAYRGPCHFYQYGFSLTPAHQHFVVYELNTTPPYEWHYCRLQEFGRLIPPQALIALKLMEQAGLCPQAYWVADQRERITARVVDPILSGQFGQWFVALAEWV